MSIAALAAAMAATSAVMSVASGLSQYQQGQFASLAARRQAEAEQEQARAIQIQTGQQIAQQDWKASHLLSRIITESAAEGITEEGSQAISFASSADEARINDMYIRQAGNISAQQKEYQATLTEIQGKEEAQAATLGAITSATSGLISAGIDYYGIKSGSFGPSGSSSFGSRLLQFKNF